jgi:hypothetical protein
MSGAQLPLTALALVACELGGFEELIVSAPDLPPGGRRYNSIKLHGLSLHGTSDQLQTKFERG